MLLNVHEAAVEQTPAWACAEARAYAKIWFAESLALFVAWFHP